ncbi:aspartate aminotransferase family protein [Lysinibacillus sphaericus]|uniref:Aminotransferase n=1 Tax=Lysinibacillus sphaericus TaxID=1421 RepID=A0A2S0K2W3_LYSSH|nr:aspartate aminotransferase family protein [Lysinibacillus sphaericus]AVK97713.1 aspartate aminotransferase family protein [Lysinibacillus sphaericus]MED4543195.1 aspartate aminotransferase family protein [Lysinibacillus sphaericus]TKI20946.1 aspartate aminotransferase family protein [Lysinibacillus sphaericus]SUV16365.1 aminotransferase [Lysinibacillus sphaericus]GEC82548.1 aspartate aminotransferase family protein [Lysinibacillus sphaericus]
MTIQLKEELKTLDQKHFLHPTTSIEQQQTQGPAAIFTEGKGIYLKDLEGKSYIDGMSSLWNVNVGHGREEIAEVAKEQMATLAFSSCFASFSNEPAIRLATKIASLTPGDLNTVFFTSGGSESNDTAIKLARHYWLLKGQPARQKIISRTQSYHGVAMGATNATGIQAFRNFTNSPAPDFHYVYNQSVRDLREMIEALGPETVAAFISEPIQGAGGVNIPPEDYFKEVRKLCDEYGILFIADEVITGFGRTGKWFGMEHYGVVPDMMSFAKGVSSGYAQLGGVVISEKIHETYCQLSKGTLMHGYTYSGHALACQVGLKNIDILEREMLIENAASMGEAMLTGFKALQEKYSFIGNVRTIGLLGAIELVKNRETGELFKTAISPIFVQETMKRGLILRTVTYEQDTVVFAPPLILSKAELNEMLRILDETFEFVRKTIIAKD